MTCTLSRTRFRLRVTMGCAVVLSWTELRRLGFQFMPGQKFV